MVHSVWVPLSAHGWPERAREADQCGVVSLMGSRGSAVWAP